MIEKLKELRYKSKEQLEFYEQEKEMLSYEDKNKILNELLNEEIFAYLELISRLLFDLANVTPEYLILLEKISDKIKNDMAQGSFLNTLKEVGYKKEKIALELYKKIISESKNDYLKIVSGLILGGYSISHEEEFKEMIKEDKSVLELVSYLKAILVLYEKNQKLPQEIIQFLNKIGSSKEQILLRELANISMVLYNKDEEYFYKKIDSLVTLNNLEINYLIFSRLSYLKVMDKPERFKLIEKVKDSEEQVIDEAIQIFMECPEETEKIGDLIIYWINRGLEFKLRNYSWVLEEISKKNPLYLDYFLDNLSKIKNSYFVLPDILVLLLKNNLSYSMKKIIEFQGANKIEDRMFYELARKIIGAVYTDYSNFDDLVILLDRLVLISKSKRFISFNPMKINALKSKPSDKTILKNNYDELVNIAYDILSQLQSKKEEYDFVKIQKSIEKYPELSKLSRGIILECQKKDRFSPILWLGEREEPINEEIQIKESDSPLLLEIKRGFIRSQFYPRTYLSEIESSIKLSQNIPNGKFNQKDIEENLKKNFADERRFWTYLSEVIFLNALNNKKINIIEIEPKVPNKSENNLDLKINLFDKDIYFEITRPELDRSLKLSNGAVGLGNKSFSVIDKKYRQIFSETTYKEIQQGKRKDLFFVVIDTSNSTIDEYSLLNSFFGSFSYTLQIDKKSGKVINEHPSRQADSLGDKNPNTGIVTGVIYFKQDLSLRDNKPRILLIGDVILNPNAINTLTQEELQELKRLIFS